MFSPPIDTCPTEFSFVPGDDGFLEGVGGEARDQNHVLPGAPMQGTCLVPSALSAPDHIHSAGHVGSQPGSVRWTCSTGFACSCADAALASKGAQAT